MSESATGWHLNGEDGPRGPYSTKMLLGWLAAGMIGADWFVWREGMAEWARIADVDELKPAPDPITLGKYQLLARVSHGAMGEIWEGCSAADPKTRVAIKLIPEFLAGDPALVERLRREAEAVRRLEHPGIVRFIEIGEADGRLFFVMELLRGETLAERLARESPLPIAELERIAAALAEALAFIHSRKIIHRDLKPSNIFITSSGEVKLIDLGVAKVLDEASLTVTGSHFGTPAYMSPEAFRDSKSVTAAADIWSLGVILYECVTGQLPFAGKTAASIIARISDTKVTPQAPALLRPEIPEKLARLIERCIERTAARRPTANELLFAMTGRRVRVPQRRRWARVTAAIFVGVITGWLATTWWLTLDAPSPSAMELFVATDDYRALMRAIEDASHEVNRLSFPDTLYHLSPSKAQMVFLDYFLNHRMSEALFVNLGYPVFHWNDNQRNLQSALGPVLISRLRDFFSRHQGPDAINRAFLEDRALHDDVLFSLRFLVLFADSPHLDTEAKTMMALELFAILDASQLGRESNFMVDPSKFPEVNVVKTQLLMTCFRLAVQLDDQAALAEILFLPEMTKALLNDHRVLVLDNGGFDSAQIAGIRAFVEALPGHLRYPVVVTCFDRLVDREEHPNISLPDWRCPGAFNLWDEKIGASRQNQFPADFKAVESDLFMTVLAHEYTHQVDVLNPAFLRAYKERLLASAGRDSGNYLRSMFKDGFFESAPQEFVASLANMYFCSSKNAFDLALRRSRKGDLHAINQFNLMANIYSDSEAVYFYEISRQGTIGVKAHPITKEGGFISTLTVDGTTYKFLYEKGVITRIQ